MKSLLLNSQVFIYSSFFFVLVNISGKKVSVPDAKPSVSIIKDQDCTTDLQNINDNLKSDPDGILNEEQIGSYEKCVAEVEPTLDYHNLDNYFFMLDCYTNLMDYYDLVVPDEGKLNEIEDKIENISLTELEQ